MVQLQANLSERSKGEAAAVAMVDALSHLSPVAVMGQAGAVRVSVTADTLADAEGLVIVALRQALLHESTDVVSVVRYTPTAELPTAETPGV